MKRLLLPALALCFSGHACFAGGWFGPSPWANATYYPGNLNGKYQAAVSGVNTTGVLGFAIRDGAPPFLQSLSQQSVTSGTSNSVVSNQEINIDNSLNYFAIFVNGRSYVGDTVAGINYDNNTVIGTLVGTAPTSTSSTNQQISSQLITNLTIGPQTNTTQQVTTQLITNSVVTAVTNSNAVVTTGLFTNVFTTNLVTTNITITNVGGLPVTNEVVTTNYVNASNVQTVFITNFNTVISYVTNTNIESVLFTNNVNNVAQSTNTTIETSFFTNNQLNVTTIATGVDGGFQANITGKRGVFTFQGSGQLSSPGPVVAGQQVNPITAFNVNGIRVSFSSEAAFQNLNPQPAAGQQ